MSFLLSALGGLGRALLPAAGGWLLNQAQPYIEKIPGAIGQLINGAYKNLKSGGLTHAKDYLIGSTIDSKFNNGKDYAAKASVERRSPIMTSGGKSAADSLRERLKQGYGGQFKDKGGGGGNIERK